MKNKLIAIFAFACLTAAAQTPTPTPTVSVLPNDMVSTGIAWNRYATATPYSEVTTVAIRIGTSNVYSWSTLDTPIAATPAGGTPVPSSIRTGAAYVFAQSPGAAISAFALGDFGLATTPSASVAQYSGGLGVAIRIAKSHWYVMPLYRITGTSGLGVQAAPELQLAFSF